MSDKSRPAFPRNGHPDKNDFPVDGMTLREYYAGLAMQGLASNPSLIDGVNGNVSEWISKYAPMIADALITALQEAGDDY